MKNKQVRSALLAGLVCLGTASALQAQDLVSGADARTLAMTCAGCHGVGGTSVGPASPIISAMYPDYFIEIMEGFRDGEIYSTIMGRIAKGYTDEEIELMAEYFHQQPFATADQEFDPELADEGAKLHNRYCKKCHAEGGRPLEDEEYYILAGQWTPYLKAAMADFTEERRPIDRKMKKQLDKLLESEGKEGLEALFAFFASQRSTEQ